MSDGIYSALSGAVAQQRALDVVANNVANAGTVGFRADRLAFAEAVSREAGDGPAADDLRYVTIARAATDETGGPLQQTGNPLDLALSGDGLFAVNTDDGVRYTRAGSFRLDEQGVLRTQSGHALRAAEAADPAHPELRVPPGATEVGVSEDGTVSADGDVIGRIDVRRFDPGTLTKEGLTLFTARGDGEPATETRVLQGYLEGANVSPVGGMNELITASRAFEAFQRVIQAFRQIDERAARDLGSNG